MASFANKLNTLIAGPTTPMTVKQKLPTSKPTPTIAPPKPTDRTTGTNAQTEQMAKTLEKTKKVQKTYGVPGAK